MTARRQARAAAPAAPDDDIVDILARADAPIWQDQELYRDFMAEHGWDSHLPAAERLGHVTSPGNRRNHAAGAWAAENGVTRDVGTHPNWPRLRDLGLIARTKEIQ